MSAQPDNSTTLRSALTPEALRDALRPSRPVFANPWESEVDMFACYVAVSFVDPFLLWLGGKLMAAIFGFSAHWPLGVFMAAALVGAAGFITIVGRERTRLSVDILAIAAWLVLGFIVAPIVGLAPPPGVAIACYAVLLVVIFVYVIRFGHFQIAFLRTVSWPITWTLLAVFFAWAAHQLILYPS
ncbi:MAG TPA: hypothetical protein VN880_04425 [Solirubrobacteraceae bacterium]|nr:hypothetical protein [Solirubrobacteraceae bacterium]